MHHDATFPLSRPTGEGARGRGRFQLSIALALTGAHPAKALLHTLFSQKQIWGIELCDLHQACWFSQSCHQFGQIGDQEGDAQHDHKHSEALTQARNWQAMGQS